jgi:hypothetical protein
MLFMFDLEVEGLTDHRGRALADECLAVGAWPVSFVEGRVEKRWFGIEKFFPPVIEVATSDDDGTILAPNASRDAAAIAMRVDALPRLALTTKLISDHFPTGYIFRATWSGAPIQVDEHVTPDQLAQLIGASALNEFTRYRVARP